ncbi:MAG: fibronectin type III domain-containing protein [Thermoanaerobaculia bacterium]
MKRLCGILLLVLAAAACGKKSEPLPPVPPLPARTTDLKVEQQGVLAEISFTFPSGKMDGSPLTDLDAVEIYRIAGPAASLSAPPAGASRGGSADHAPISGQRRRAQALRMREAAFFDSAAKIAVLKSDLFPSATRGSQLVYNDSLSELLKAPGPVSEIGYAIVTVRRNGLRSEISNIATLKPVAPPAAPRDLLATAEENRICLTWQPPPGEETRGSEIAGYNVYRRRLEDEDYANPLNPAPVESTDYADASAAYGSVYVYTVTAVPKDHPKSEGPPAIQFGIRYDDVYPPPAVSRLDALPEQTLVRLHWPPVEAPDLAGYDLYRSENGGPEAKLNEKPLTEPSFVDTRVAVGKHYSYRVRSVDRKGNASLPSPAAEARPFLDD